MPKYIFRRELRKNKKEGMIDPTSLVLISISTIDTRTKDIFIVGYAAI